MRKKIVLRGVVSEEVRLDNRKGNFRLKTHEQEYEIYSRDIQAVKDYLFIRKGQKMQVEGILGDEEEEKTIESTKSRIVSDY